MTENLETVKVTADEKVVLELYRRAKVLRFSELEVHVQDGKATAVRVVEKVKLI